MAPLVLCVGISVLDYQVELSKYPEPDTKHVADDQRVSGGGNAANTSVALARLGVRVKLLSKIGPDAAGSQICAELEQEGVDCNLVLQGRPGEHTVTAFLIVSGKTRNIISMPYRQRVPDLLAADVRPDFLEGVSLVHADGRHPRAALRTMQLAREKGVPVLVEAEQRTPPVGWTVAQACEQLAELLRQADFVITSETYPCVATGEANVTDGLKALLSSQAPNARWAVATLGDNGCVAVCRRPTAATESDREPDAKRRCKELTWDEVRVPAFRLRDEDVVDTTGAGDAFIGGLAYGIVHDMPLERILKIACWVGAQNCTGRGARGGMPTAEQMSAAIGL